MPEQSPFGAEWRASLEAHFTHMVRVGAQHQRQDAIALLKEAGYSDAAVNDLYIAATMHVDELPDNFVPDMHQVEALREASRAHPLECTCPNCGTKPSPKT